MAHSGGGGSEVKALIASNSQQIVNRNAKNKSREVHKI